MKRIIVMFLLFVCLVSGCKCQNSDDSQLVIPQKKNSTDNDVLSSPINVYNLDDYLFRDDVQYVDVRKIEMIASEGYVAGFQFIPFYSIIASFAGEGTLYKMQRIFDENNKIIGAGQVGTFKAMYEESDSIINSLFSKDKYIFIISQGGSEATYVINLLIQLGYNPELLYNVGGVMNSEGYPSYSSMNANSYFVEGTGNLDMSVKFDFMSDLTPIN